MYGPEAYKEFVLKEMNEMQLLKEEKRLEASLEARKASLEGEGVHREHEQLLADLEQAYLSAVRMHILDLKKNEMLHQELRLRLNWEDRTAALVM